MSRQGCLQSPPGDQSCETKPISQPGSRPASILVGWHGWGQPRQTKPISRHGQEGVRTGKAAGGAAPRTTMRNKANFPGATRRASPLEKESYDEWDPKRASAKQSQFPRASRQGRFAKPPPRPIMQNKANSKRVPGKVSAFLERRYNKCGSQRGSAKQSQFLGSRRRVRSVRPCMGTGQENRTVGMVIPRRL